MRSNSIELRSGKSYGGKLVTGHRRRANCETYFYLHICLCTYSPKPQHAAAAGGLRDL